jgi:3-methyladenine DNA glycosylase Tag
MAKKSGGPNKSQAIREYYAAHPNAKPKEISAELKKQGIDVTPAFISTIRSTSMGKKKKTVKTASAKAAPKAASVKASAPAKSTSNISIESLIKAKGLVRDLGGIDAAIATLTALKRLAD